MLTKEEFSALREGRGYVNNPENKFTVTVLGAVAELERRIAAPLAVPACLVAGRASAEDPRKLWVGTWSLNAVRVAYRPLENSTKMHFQ